MLRNLNCGESCHLFVVGILVDTSEKIFKKFVLFIFEYIYDQSTRLEGRFLDIPHEKLIRLSTYLFTTLHEIRFPLPTPMNKSSFQMYPIVPCLRFVHFVSFALSSTATPSAEFLDILASFRISLGMVHNSFYWTIRNRRTTLNCANTMKYFSLATAVLAAACTQVASQELPPLFSDPVLLWQSQLTADVNLGPTDVLKGNGVFMAPDGMTAYVTTVGATVYAFDAYSGAALWTYQPETVGTSITRSHSGLSFGPTADYMVYSVVDNENSLNPET